MTVTSINVSNINEQMVALIEVTITSLMKSPLIEVIVTSPINEQMVGAIKSPTIMANLVSTLHDYFFVK